MGATHNQDGSPRKVRSDARLKGLPEPQQKLVAEWLQEDGPDACVQRIKAELEIETSKSALYEALAYWRTQAQFTAFRSLAIAQAELEAEEQGGLTKDQMEEAVDRNFLALATLKQDPALYKDVRYLQIADQSAKANARIAEAKLTQGEAKLRQKDRDLALAERRVAVLEAKLREAAGVLTEGEDSPETRVAKMRQIFGIA